MAGFYYQHLRSAIEILEGYRFNDPFSIYLKNYFRRFKKFGSRDRKAITDLCFGYFRIGQSSLNYNTNDQIIIGYFLTHQSDDGFIEATCPDLLTSIGCTLDEKIEKLRERFPAFDEGKIFSFTNELTGKIDQKSFRRSHLQKPLYFINIRQKSVENFLNRLNEYQIPYVVTDGIIGFEQNIDLSNWFKIDEEIFVQDISSQKTITLLDQCNIAGSSLWDTCAGSGGKSILASDKFHFKKHYVSDLRQHILDELSRRLTKASIKYDQSFCVDLTNSLSIQVAKQYLPKEGVELIIADVPCTGSGTWGRSPEWLRNFDVHQITAYQQRQINIVKHILPLIKKGGFFLYITCSVFEQENEFVIEEIKKSHTIKVIEQKYFFGYGNRGDQLFAALITL